jgi:hypothetical protein
MDKEGMLLLGNSVDQRAAAARAALIKFEQSGRRQLRLGLFLFVAWMLLLCYLPDLGLTYSM